MKTICLIIVGMALTFLPSCSSSRVINYNEDAFAQQNDFNAKSFNLTGIILKTDHTSVTAEHLRISDSVLYCTILPGKQTSEIPLTHIRSIEFVKKPGAMKVGAYSLLGFTIGASMAALSLPGSSTEIVALPVIGGAVGAGVGLSKSSSTKYIFQGPTRMDSTRKLPSDKINSSTWAKHESKIVRRMVDYTDQSYKDIKDFNLLAYQRGGKLMLLDSSTFAGHDFHITDSVLTWTDLSSQKKMSIPFAGVQSVEIIKKSDTRDAVRGGTTGLAVAGIAACFIGLKMIASAQQKSQEDEDNEGNVIGAAVMAGTVVGVAVMAGLATGVSAADHDTRITVLFHEPVSSKSKLRQKIQMTTVKKDTASIVKKGALMIPDTSSAVRKENSVQANRQTTVTQQTQKQPTVILKKDQIETPRKTTFGALSWTVANMVLPLYLASNDLPSKKLKNLPRGYALLIAPSIGNFYARDTRRTLIGLGIRLCGAGLMGIGWYLTPKDQDPNPLFNVGIITIGAGMIYSLYTTPSSVREYQARQSWSVVPFISPGSKLAGLTLQFQM